MLNMLSDLHPAKSTVELLPLLGQAPLSGSAPMLHIHDVCLCRHSLSRSLRLSSRLEYLLLAIQPARGDSPFFRHFALTDIVLPLLQCALCIVLKLLQMSLQRIARLYDLIWVCGVAGLRYDVSRLLFFPSLASRRRRERRRERLVGVRERGGFWKRDERRYGQGYLSEKRVSSCELVSQPLLWVRALNTYGRPPLLCSDLKHALRLMAAIFRPA